MPHVRLALSPLLTTRHFWAAILALLGAWLLIVSTASAQMTIEGSGGENRPYTLSIPLMLGDNATQSGTMQDLLLEDFRLSGLFEPNGLTESVNLQSFNLASWKGRSDFVLLGRLETPAQASAAQKEFMRTTTIRLFDASRGVELEGLKVNFDTRQIAIAAHQIADALIERMTGIKVGLSQLVAMVSKNGRQYNIVVSDILGKNSHSILNSTNPIISLSWSPDGKQLAYASFETGPSLVYIQNVATGERTAIRGNFDSMSAPTWSPDGKKIAFAAFSGQKTGIYEYDLNSQATRPLVTDGLINTEPAYGSDGNLYFSSNRGASPQIYRMNLASEKVERFSFEQKYCIRPSAAKLSPWVAFLNREGAGVSVVNSSTGQSREVSIPSRADGLALSPFGRLLLVSVVQGKSFQTIITNTKGSYFKTLEISAQSYYEPSWRP